MNNKFLDNLSIATTAHNNSEMSTAMLQSFEEHIGICEEIVIVDDGSRKPFEPPVLKVPSVCLGMNKHMDSVKHLI
jgi:hypothetical protein